MKLNQFILRRAALIVAIVVGILKCWLAHGAELSDAPLNVLLINSGDLFAPGASLQNNALHETLTAGTKRPVNFCAETLYAYNLSAIDFDKEFISFMHRKYQGQKIDLIVTAGTAALNFLERNRADLWPEAPAMFYSVDDDKFRQRKLPPSLTGLTLKFDPASTLDFAVQLQPNARRVVVVTGASESDHFWLPDIQYNLQNRHPTLNATYLTNQTIAQLTEELAKLSPDTIVFFTTFFTDASGKHYQARDVPARLAAVSRAPIYGLYDILLDHGIVGGVLTSLEDHGRRAGELALRIVAGEKPDAIAVPPAAPAVPMVDWRQLQKWGISESRLPPGTIVRFRPPTLWQLHKDFIIGGLCIVVGQTVTIAALLLQLARRKRVEAVVREDEKRMILAADAARLGIWIRNFERNEIWATDQWRTLMGFSKSERIDLDGYLQKLHPEDREAVSRILVKVTESDGHYETEYRVVLPDGKIRWIAARGRVELDGVGKPIRVRDASVDVTARKQAELEVIQQRSELAHLSRVTMLGELSGSLAHELNQPLTAILSNAQAAQRFLAHDKVDIVELREILADIVAEDNRAGEVIHRLRLLFKKGEVQYQPIDMNHLVFEVLKLVRSDLVNHGVTVHTELAPSLPVLHGDRVQFQQVLLNLVMNACDAMNGDANVERQLIVRTKLTSDQYVEVSVSDCGHGIPSDKLEQIFEPFFTTKPHGMGLGLSVCRTIINAHGGKFWAANNAKLGATFHFTLPSHHGGNA